jgi:hypothetical protein
VASTPHYADIDMLGVSKVTGLPTPVGASDAVPKSYVDAVSGGGGYQSPLWSYLA